MTDVLEIIVGDEIPGSLRERVKRGEISPQSALLAVQAGEEGLTSPDFLRWCKTTGQRRFDEARKNIGQTEKKVDTDAPVEDTQTPRKRKRRKDRTR